MLIGHMVRTHIQPVQTVHALYAEVLLAIYFTICHPIPLSTWSETEAASPNIKIFISLTTVLSLLTRVFCPIRGGVKVRCFWKSSLRETSWDAMTSGGQLHQRQFHQKLQQCHNFPTLISNPSFGTCLGCAQVVLPWSESFMFINNFLLAWGTKYENEDVSSFSFCISFKLSPPRA